MPRKTKLKRISCVRLVLALAIPSATFVFLRQTSIQKHAGVKLSLFAWICALECQPVAMNSAGHTNERCPKHDSPASQGTDAVRVGASEVCHCYVHGLKLLVPPCRQQALGCNGKQGLHMSCDYFNQEPAGKVS